MFNVQTLSSGALLKTGIERRRHRKEPGGLTE
jgi:hypothetical protein